MNGCAQRIDFTILQAVALPMFSCFAVCSGVISAFMSFFIAETFSLESGGLSWVLAPFSCGGNAVAGAFCDQSVILYFYDS